MIIVKSYGRKHGNSSLAREDGNLVQNIEKAEKIYGKILLMRPDFVNVPYMFKCEDLGGAVVQVPTNLQSYIMKAKLDCIFAPLDFFGAVAIANADCPVVAGVVQNNEGKKYIFLAHCGTNNLLPVNKSKPMILCLKEFMDEKKLLLKEMYIGSGIGPCCYGLENFDSLISRMSTIQKFIKKAVKGPMVTRSSLDLMSLIDYQINKVFNGSMPNDVVYDKKCTACELNEDRERRNYSNVYSESEFRNLTVIGIQKTTQ